MEVIIRCKNQEKLENAKQYMAEKYTGITFETHPIYKYVSFVMGADAGGVSFLEELLERFPELDISATVISDVEGRDSSWWSTITYESGTDADGKRIMERTGGGTYWA